MVSTMRIWRLLFSLPTYRSASNIVDFNSDGPASFNRKVSVWFLSRFNDEPLVPVVLVVVPDESLRFELKLPESFMLNSAMDADENNVGSAGTWVC